ncbi:hypothetical protein LOK74_22605 [Brevibacillus humidisoli]|uniref:hypothetical protein n=1 Tax=Brevibacillus humidisoli TaxID=2895522 RepID=UPI001E5D990F|nr:hypothetical protein [Brevibacillus humidisoli]UFJ40749.1 hypothetical protein LOK74_22605 [Brevibacillus humidisoli]
MRVGKWLIAAVVLAGIALGWLFAADTMSARYQAIRFLDHLTSGQFERAFDYVYYYNRAYDEEVTISEEEARKIWVDRVKRLKEQGTYVKAYQDLRVWQDDGWVNGRAVLSVVENGGEQRYEVYVAFNKEQGQWKVSNLQPLLPEPDDRNQWQSALKGYVGDPPVISAPFAKVPVMELQTARPPDDWQKVKSVPFGAADGQPAVLLP